MNVLGSRASFGGLLQIEVACDIPLDPSYLLVTPSHRYSTEEGHISHWGLGVFNGSTSITNGEPVYMWPLTLHVAPKPLVILGAHEVTPLRLIQ